MLSNVGWSLYCAIQAMVLIDEDYWYEATGFWNAVVEALDSDEMLSTLPAVTGG